MINKESILIKCKLIDSLNKYKYNIRIYDDNNNLINSGITDIKGNYYFLLREDGIYKIIVSNYQVIDDRVFVMKLEKDKMLELALNFNNYTLKKKSPVTIILKDFNYEGLPIIKGRIILCQISK